MLGLVHLYSSDPGNPLDGGGPRLHAGRRGPTRRRPGESRRPGTIWSTSGTTSRSRKSGNSPTGCKRAERANASLRQTLAVDGEMVGDSAATRRLKVRHRPDRSRRRHRAGAGGERRGQGTGGAQAIHLGKAAASDGPMVTMNCAALTESPARERTVRPRERGLHRGDGEDRVGKFEAADGGTLFLDEVGEMSPAIQAKFLRVLEGHPFERVGGRQPISGATCGSSRPPTGTSSGRWRPARSGGTSITGCTWWC